MLLFWWTFYSSITFDWVEWAGGGNKVLTFPKEGGSLDGKNHPNVINGQALTVCLWPGRAWLRPWAWQFTILWPQANLAWPQITAMRGLPSHESRAADQQKPVLTNYISIFCFKVFFVIVLIVLLCHDGNSTSAFGHNRVELPHNVGAAKVVSFQSCCEGSTHLWPLFCLKNCCWYSHCYRAMYTQLRKS